MTKNHARKQRARARKQASGASYTSTASGTAHVHDGPAIGPLDGTGFGADRTADMRTAAALIGACLQECVPCQRSLADTVLAGDRLVVAGLAGTVYSLLPSPGPVVSPTTRAFHPLAQASRSGDGVPVLAFVDALDRQELEDLLEDTLDAWAGTAELAARADQTAPRSREHQGVDDTEEFNDRGQSLPGEGQDAAAVWGCAYLTSAGMDHYLDQEELAALPQLAEQGAATGRPVICHLCDQAIDVLTDTEVHIGLAVLPGPATDPDGGPVVPVFTHSQCGAARVWSWAALAAERQRRSLPVADHDRPSGEEDGPLASATAGGPAREAEDLALFSMAQLTGGVYPLLVIEPGTPHPHGADGHHTDLLSAGLHPVDLSSPVAPDLPGWQLRLNGGRLAAITRSGAGAWYRSEPGHPTPGMWRTRAREQRAALLLVVPPGTLGTGIVAGAEEERKAALARAAAAGRVLGGVLPVRGTLS